LFSTEERFREYTERDTASGCLVWTGAKSSTGYGYMTKPGGGMEHAHRHAWRLVYGEIASSTWLDHSCHRRDCVEVSHLRIATPPENGANRRGPNRNGSTGVRNVHRHGDSYRVRVVKCGQIFEGGLFKDLDTAAAAAKQLRHDLNGAFAGEGAQRE
jgi:hypothetical protein